jgi:hypothetical protein
LRHRPFGSQGKQASIVPVEGAASTQSGSPFGANNEQLPERLQSALRRIVQQFSTESESTRRQEIRRIKQAHQFWRGLQYLWWSERDQNWHLPFEQKLTDGSSIEDLPLYEFVTKYLPGLRPLDRQRAFAGRAARALFPRVGAGGRRCIRRESRHGSRATRRTQQSHREFNRR